MNKPAKAMKELFNLPDEPTRFTLIAAFPDDKFSIQTIIQAPVTNVIEDILFGLFQLMHRSVEQVKPEDRDGVKQQLRDGTVAMFSALVEDFHPTLTPKVEEELRQIAKAMTESDHKRLDELLNKKED